MVPNRATHHNILILDRKNDMNVLWKIAHFKNIFLRHDHIIEENIRSNEAETLNNYQFSNNWWN